MRTYGVIDTETGELVQDGSAYVRHRKQDEAYRNKLEKERYQAGTSGKHWVASYHDPIGEISQELSLTQTGAIIKLLPYMRFKSEGKLIKDGKPLKQADIQRILKRGKRATITILNKLEEKGVITVMKEGRSNVYYISARFHEKGNVRDSERFTKLYQKKTQEITDKLPLHEAGILYKIMPYFHFSEYYLVRNPNEQDTDKLEYLSREELAELIGMDKNALTGSVAKLKNLGALMATDSGRKVRYIVHPDVMFRQSIETEWTDAVRRLFEHHRK